MSSYWTSRLGMIEQNWLHWPTLTFVAFQWMTSCSKMFISCCKWSISSCWQRQKHRTITKSQIYTQKVIFYLLFFYVWCLKNSHKCSVSEEVLHQRCGFCFILKINVELKQSKVDSSFIAHSEARLNIFCFLLNIPLGSTSVRPLIIFPNSSFDRMFL